MKTAFVPGDIIALSTTISSAQGFPQSTICADPDELPNLFFFLVLASFSLVRVSSVMAVEAQPLAECAFTGQLLA